MMKHRSLSVTSALFAAVVLINAGVTEAQVVDLLPNLTPLPASEFVISQDPTNGRVLLRFAAINTNLGFGPLDVRAGGASSEGQVVYQRIYRSDGNYYDSEVPGTMTYHPQHNHFHVNGFALYTLRGIGGATTLGKTSEKTSFCIEDTTPIDLRMPGAPQSGVYTTCNPTMQGLSVGWGDRYGPNLDGQSFDITGDPEGDYELIIATDPVNNFVETNEGDNVSCIRLHINSAAKTVQPLGICGAVNVFSITPNNARPGSSVNVTIIGSGFAPGMAVTFENGTGSAPTVSNVVVVNASTITATVTIKKGGGKQGRVWDVRVGSGTLFKAFTIK
jgi:hypothetical protein